jgi:hypothetical protein
MNLKINRGGRPKGSKNKINSNIREMFEQLVNYNLVNMQTDLNELSPKDRLEILLKLSEFIIPKLNRVDNTLSAENRQIDIIIQRVDSNGMIENENMFTKEIEITNPNDINN